MIFRAKIKVIIVVILVVISLFILIGVIIPFIITRPQGPYLVKSPVSILKHISNGQDIYRRQIIKDTDNDKKPEYASNINELLELEFLDKSSFKPTDQEGEAYYKKLGYICKIYTPQEPDMAEEHFCIYAWPKKYKKNTTRTYVVTEDGMIYWTDNPKYSGLAKGPKLEDAFIGQPFKSLINREKWKLID